LAFFDDNKLAKQTYAKTKDYQEIFLHTQAGKRILHDLMHCHHVNGSTFHREPPIFAFKEGERNVVLRILKILNVKPEDLQKRMEEKTNGYEY